MSAQDTLDDDDERVTLSFGAMPDERVSEGTPNATMLEIDDDDDPEVTVSFALSSYRVGEGSSVTVTTVPQRASLFSVASGPHRTIFQPARDLRHLFSRCSITRRRVHPSTAIRANPAPVAGHACRPGSVVPPHSSRDSEFSGRRRYRPALRPWSSRPAMSSGAARLPFIGEGQQVIQRADIAQARSIDTC